MINHWVKSWGDFSHNIDFPNFIKVTLSSERVIFDNGVPLIDLPPVQFQTTAHFTRKINNPASDFWPLGSVTVLWRELKEAFEQCSPDNISKDDLLIEYGQLSEDIMIACNNREEYWVNCVLEFHAMHCRMFDEPFPFLIEGHLCMMKYK